MKTNNLSGQTKTYMQIYREQNKEKIALKKKEYREKKRNEINEYNKKYREQNKDKIYENRKKLPTLNSVEYKQKIKEYQKKYREENREILTIKNKERRKTDLIFKLKGDIRNFINTALKRKNIPKNSKTESILGCTFEEFKTHLESQFESWMTWENKGNPKDGILEPNKSWDIDHIIPITVGNSEDEVIKLNHYTNLKPLCSYVNRYVKKGKY